MPKVTYQLSHDTLTVSGDLNWPLEIRFDIETQALVDSVIRLGLTDVAIDLLEVTAMGSQYIGALAAVAAALSNRGATLTIRAKGQVAGLLQQCGLDRLMQLETP